MVGDGGQAEAYGEWWKEMDVKRDRKKSLNLFFNSRYISHLAACVGDQKAVTRKLYTRRRGQLGHAYCAAEGMLLANDRK